MEDNFSLWYLPYSKNADIYLTVRQNMSLRTVAVCLRGRRAAVMSDMLNVELAFTQLTDNTAATSTSSSFCVILRRISSENQFPSTRDVCFFCGCSTKKKKKKADIRYRPRRVWCNMATNWGKCLMYFMKFPEIFDTMECTQLYTQIVQIFLKRKCILAT